MWNVCLLTVVPNAKMCGWIGSQGQTPPYMGLGTPVLTLLVLRNMGLGTLVLSHPTATCFHSLSLSLSLHAAVLEYLAAYIT